PGHPAPHARGGRRLRLLHLAVPADRPVHAVQRDDDPGSDVSRRAPRRILVVDNYDSFVWTIVGYLEQLGASTTVVRNDEPVGNVTDHDGVLVSPGPGTPKEAGSSREVIEACAAAR